MKSINLLDKQILNVKPYNGLWIDCINNNILGILSTYNSSFEQLPYTLEVNYTLVKPKLDTIVGCPENHTLNVKYNLPDLSHWVQFNYLQDEVSSKVLDIIKQLINERNYLFIEVDRYYFPGGIEFKKTHKIHPTFIYGYNDNEKSLYLIEDCVQLGNFTHYKISYENFILAYEAAKTVKDPNFLSVNLRDDIAEFHLNKNVIKDNLKKLLKHSTSRTSIDKRQYTKFEGLKSIQEFSSILEKIYPEIYIFDIGKLVSITLPWQLQKRNISMINSLEKNNFIESAHSIFIQQEYIELAKMWEKYRYKLYKYIVMKEDGPQFNIDTSYFSKVSELLQEIYIKETNVTKLLYDSLN